VIYAASSMKIASAFRAVILLIRTLIVVGLLAILQTTRAETEFSARFEEIKKNASNKELYRFLYALPKGGDIHNHQDGSSWPEWWYKVATDKSINHGETFYTRTRITNESEANEQLLYFLTIPQWQYDQLSAEKKQEYEPLDKLDADTKAKWLSAFWLDNPTKKGRDEFFDRIWPRLEGMTSNPYVTIELLIENMKQFGAEGVRYIETQNADFGLDGPSYYDRHGNVVTMDQVAEMYRARLREADAVATGVTVRFQGVVLRFTPFAIQGVEDAYAFVDRNRDYWVGINMAGREDNERGYPAKFLNVYRKMLAKYPGIKLSIHAGESDEPNHHIRDTLILGANRIGHGINLLSDPDTMLSMKANKNLIEINLISNKVLEYVPNFADHPFPVFLRFGIPVCLNTDDRGMWGSNMTDEYFVAIKNFNLSWEEVVQVGQNSLEYSFAQPDIKRQLLQSYFDAVAKFEKRFSADWKSELGSMNDEMSPYAKRELVTGSD
jgi:adenosine deaminase CECR1